MKPITKFLKLPRVGYYEAHLSIINGLLPVRITPKEIEVLARFMSFNGEFADDRFGTSARKRVKEEMNISDSGLSGYLRILKDKGFIQFTPDNPKDLSINPILVPDPDSQEYRFLLSNEDHTHS